MAVQLVQSRFTEAVERYARELLSGRDGQVVLVWEGVASGYAVWDKARWWQGRHAMEACGSRLVLDCMASELGVLFRVGAAFERSGVDGRYSKRV